MSARHLEAELEAALVRELTEQYRLLAHAYFKNALTLPLVALVDTRARLGLWIEATRTIELSRPLVLEQPWGVVVEVLKHEMAHQYVHEILEVFSETAHGPAFRETCERFGFDGAAAGMPQAAPSDPSRKMAERIARLLALAESPNVHEA